MNKSETIKRRHENEQLRQLVDQWTRADIMARFGPFRTLEYADWFRVKLEKEDEMRKLLFGTSNLVDINDKLGLVKRKKMKKRKKSKSQP